MYKDILNNSALIVKAISELFDIRYGELMKGPDGMYISFPDDLLRNIGFRALLHIQSQSYGLKVETLDPGIAGFNIVLKPIQLQIEGKNNMTLLQRMGRLVNQEWKSKDRPKYPCYSNCPNPSFYHSNNKCLRPEGRCDRYLAWYKWLRLSKDKL